MILSVGRVVPGRAELTSGYPWAAGESAGGWPIALGHGGGDSTQFQMALPPPAG